MYSSDKANSRWWSIGNATARYDATNWFWDLGNGPIAESIHRFMNDVSKLDYKA